MDGNNNQFGQQPVNEQPGYVQQPAQPVQPQQDPCVASTQSSYPQYGYQQASYQQPGYQQPQQGTPYGDNRRQGQGWNNEPVSAPADNMTGTAFGDIAGGFTEITDSDLPF